MTSDERRTIIFLPNGGVALLFFKGVNRAMTVPFKVHPVMRFTGVGKKLQRALRQSGAAYRPGTHARSKRHQTPENGHTPALGMGGRQLKRLV